MSLDKKAVALLARKLVWWLGRSGKDSFSPVFF
jgi:hypothetical protein